ncbi:MAG: DUF11 domain-containing protein [Anaerolineae bacterium]|nr:DUF11 domain-containing protein [Anaerolineae bacterium]
MSGNEVAPSVALVDSILATTYVVGSCTNTCGGPDPLVWALGNQNPGAAGSVSFSVTVNSPLNNGTQIRNSASITDSTGLTKTTTVTTPVTSAHDVFITKTVSPAGNVSPGTELRYTLNWSVSGNEVAPSVTLVDSIPANTTYVVGSCTNSAAGRIRWSGPWATDPGAAGGVSFSVTGQPAEQRDGSQQREHHRQPGDKTTTVTTPSLRPMMSSSPRR